MLKNFCGEPRVKLKRKSSDLISNRTRSKLRLQEIPLYKLEEELPVTEVAHESVEDSTDLEDQEAILWKAWLMNLNRDDEPDLLTSKVLTEDDDEDFLIEMEQNVDEEDLVPSIKISLNELNSIFDSLSENKFRYEEESHSIEECDIDSISADVVQEKFFDDFDFDLISLALNEKQIETVKAQLNQYIQLLIQLFVLSYKLCPEISKTVLEMLVEISDSKLHDGNFWDVEILKEMKVMNPSKTFSRSSIKEAMRVVNSWIKCQVENLVPVATNGGAPGNLHLKNVYGLDDQAYSRIFHNIGSVLSPDGVIPSIPLMACSDAPGFFLLDPFFSLYPKLLPCYKSQKKSLTCSEFHKFGRWTTTEDHLIILGVVNWQCNYASISRKLLVTRNHTQIRQRWDRISANLGLKTPLHYKDIIHNELVDFLSTDSISDEFRSLTTNERMQSVGIISGEKKIASSNLNYLLSTFFDYRQWDLCIISVFGEFQTEALPENSSKLISKEIRYYSDHYGYALVSLKHLRTVKPSELRSFIKPVARTDLQVNIIERNKQAITFISASGQEFQYHRKSFLRLMPLADDSLNYVVYPVSLKVAEIAQSFVRVFFETLENETKIQSPDVFLQILKSFASLIDCKMSDEDMMKFVLLITKPWPESENLLKIALDLSNGATTQLFWMNYFRIMLDMKEIQNVAGSGDSKSRRIFRYLSRITPEIINTYMLEELIRGVDECSDLYKKIKFRSYPGTASVCSLLEANLGSFEKLKFEDLTTFQIPKTKDGFDKLCLPPYTNQVVPNYNPN